MQHTQQQQKTGYYCDWHFNNIKYTDSSFKSQGSSDVYREDDIIHRHLYIYKLFKRSFVNVQDL